MIQEISDRKANEREDKSEIGEITGSDDKGQDMKSKNDWYRDDDDWEEKPNEWEREDEKADMLKMDESKEVDEEAERAATGSKENMKFGDVDTADVVVEEVSDDEMEAFWRESIWLACANMLGSKIVSNNACESSTWRLRCNSCGVIRSSRCRSQTARKRIKSDSDTALGKKQ